MYRRNNNKIKIMHIYIEILLEPIYNSSSLIDLVSSFSLPLSFFLYADNIINKCEYIYTWKWVIPPFEMKIMKNECHVWDAQHSHWAIRTFFFSSSSLIERYAPHTPLLHFEMKKRIELVYLDTLWTFFFLSYLGNSRKVEKMCM